MRSFKTWVICRQRIFTTTPSFYLTDILNLIESYDNLILMVLDTFHYVAFLILDFISYIILVIIGGVDTSGGRNNIKGDLEEMISLNNRWYFIPHEVLMIIAD